jgi:hypothetical protein
MGETAMQENERYCINCGTPVQVGITTQYMPELDIEVCAVCEQPLIY